MVRKNPHYPRRKQILPPIIEQNSSAHSLITTSANSLTSRSTPSTPRTPTIKFFKSSGFCTAADNTGSSPYAADEICKMCKNNFKSCEFCNKNIPRKLSTRSSSFSSSIGLTTGILNTGAGSRNSISSCGSSSSNGTMSTYNPVYNIREIRTVCNSFSSLGIDKKLLEVETNNNMQMKNSNGVVMEVVNNNPSKGYGNFVYI